MPPAISAVGRLWQTALAQHGISPDDAETNGMVGRISEYWRSPITTNNDDDLVNYLEAEITRFGDFRSPRRNILAGRFSEKDPPPTKTIVKIRKGLKPLVVGFKNISSLAGQGAGIGFAPAEFIVTVVAHIAGSFIAVSDDYDLIEQVFVIMGSFTGRLNLLNHGMPTEKDYRDMISTVFCRMLEFCTNIRRSITTKHRRLEDFAKALYRGRDPDLRNAYDEVVRAINSLESATVMQTLAISVRTEESLADQQAVLLDVSSSLHAYMTEQGKRYEESKRNNNNIEKMVKQLLWQTGPADTAIPTSPQAELLQSVDRMLRTGAEGYVARHLTEMMRLHVRGSCSWVEETPAYRALLESAHGVLCIEGKPGMGKSVLAAAVFQKLQAQYRGDSTTSVAYFAFDRSNQKLRLVLNMLLCCAAQVAQLDVGYREGIKVKLDAREGLEEAKGMGRAYWDDLFDGQFGPEQDTPRRLFLVVDGADQIDKKEASELKRYVFEAAQKKLRIFFVIVGALSLLEGSPRADMQPDPHTNAEAITEPPPDSAAETETPIIWKLFMEAGKLRGAGEFKRVATVRLESFGNLSRLQPAMKKRIVGTIHEKADNFLYIDHALRKLDVTRIGVLISRGLPALPGNTEGFYGDLFRECGEVYSPDELAIVGCLLTWLAYGQEGTRPLSLAAAQILVDHAIQRRGSAITFRVQDQIRLLAISEDDRGDELLGPAEPRTETDEEESPVDETSQENGQEEADSEISITFQEPSLRDYFRQSGDGKSAHCALQPSQLDAHVMMVQLATDVLLAETAADEKTSARCSLKDAAAANWMAQFFAGVQLVKSSPREAAVRRLLFGELKKVLGSEASVRRLEETVDVTAGSVYCSVFGATQETAQLCMKLARQLGEEEDEQFSWTDFLQSVARIHIESWLAAQTYERAYQALRFAHLGLCNAGVAGFVDQQKHDYRDLPPSKIVYPVMTWSAGSTGTPTARHYSHASWTMTVFNEYDEARQASEKAVQLIDEAKGGGNWQERFEPRSGLAWVRFWKWNSQVTWQMDDSSLAEREEILALCDKAAAEIVFPDRDDSFDETEKVMVSMLYDMKVRLESAHPLVEVRKRAIQSLKVAMAVMPESGGGWLFCCLVLNFGNHGMWRSIMDVLGIVENPLGGQYPHGIGRIVHRAARACGQEGRLRELYRLAAAEAKLHGSETSKLRLSRAAFERFTTAVTDEEAIEAAAVAKAELWASMRSEQTSFRDARIASKALADMLLDGFLCGRTLEAKLEAQADLEEAMGWMARREGLQFEQKLAPMAVSLAIMRRRLGSAVEFRNEATAILAACRVALSDGRTGNDVASLHKAGRVLALLPACARDAQIAMACRFYHVTAGSEGTSSSASSPVVLGCDQCLRPIRGVDQARAYACVYCTEIDLCAECYGARQRHYADRTGDGDEAGDDGGDSYVEVCPWGHPYVEVPPRGWKGVEDGNILVGDTVEPFAVWRDGLEETWRAAWERQICEPHDLATVCIM